MAARHHTLSSSIASLHGDEQAVGSPLNAAELTALARTRLFGATGTVLMSIGALGAGARPVVQDPTFGVRLLNLPSRIQTVSLTMTTTGAVMMALAWLMLGRFALGKRRMSRGELDRTLVLWMLPLLIAPPMYSKDVYSYLAQSQISRDGLDPYRVGPASGLGLDHVFTLSVPSLWRETPAPYGPLFLWIGRGISDLTGENIVAAVLFHRLVVLIGVALIVWATPRLAQRCGVAEVSALWLGAANPLLFMHLVAGIHNEALMLGLMLTGAEFALRGLDAPRLIPLSGRPRPAPRRASSAERSRAIKARAAAWEPLGMLAGGAILIALSSQVKLPSLLALGFITMALAYRYGGTIKALLVCGSAMSALALSVMAVVGWASGLGFGWMFTLGTANVVRSWMSPPTLLALGTGQVGILLRLGDHTTAVLSLTRAMGVLIIMVMVSWLLLAVFRGRLHPIGGLGVALGLTVLLFPVVQPWYLLWAIIPMAAWATRTGFRVATIIITLIVGIFGPTANGDRFALFQIVDATLASAIIVLVLMALTYHRLPWRALPVESPPPAEVTQPAEASQQAEPNQQGESNQPETADPAAKPPATRRPTSTTDAYADST
ncbi:polyprenol phosphomannose-dependent alpha 1,6 mannosyltransferase MptB [Mycobacterium ulcerans]|uniref:Polyprenol phosphomannose-dependent alpha 1,6 mannosyltransferase MptB n=1 Tax=Mycobacterium ulcerans TaxID=1809 RepID=A0ABY3V949_MYCUL|nr:polyprenol phosphomannose-dependent alpha 1,6 mannosyltransferase MptB [Mycobacterium ulcerans]MEB3970277.1 polyprenol phosphomannose-dependent alpha 1,6 mannosyltransferase MptB [Mycobacterium ulcerans]MEB3978547.1 polyprenol phosphomannose-dependent alpha 1,6 mannosyltransferase MptB [Mycobacterium ulcerans]MEB4007807.1 polyprenol phosphomannose-dependent alpha 1,6 mannosyltransferase MptB [Mycobacterium ulcerans]MEB4417401.1 polyprenol phosphomannose-dependent alpha 1,6 mannosyltransferas